MSTPLQTTVRATFDNNGNATAVAGPYAAFHSWDISRLVTVCSVPTDKVTLYVYRNAINPANVLDSTFQGVQATSETDISLYQGEHIIAVWNGGTPGSAAMLNITGTDIY